MKRFYKDAGVAEAPGGYAITLDGRSVRTPARAPLVVPTQALADLIAEEWAAQGEDIAPAEMVATGLANAAIDQIAPAQVNFAMGLAAYGESDLLLYRADGPRELVQAQISGWNPLLDWAERRYCVSFTLATGIVHVPQPEPTLTILANSVLALSAFQLAGLSPLVTISGSLVCGLAVLERAFPIADIWQASELDEIWQSQQWGEDAEATARREKREREFIAAARYLETLG